MSKTKIDLLFSIQNFGIDPKVTMRALLRRANSTSRKGTVGDALIVKPKYEIARYETFQYTCSNYNKLDELFRLSVEGKNTIKMCIENMPAELIHSKRKDGSEYDAILVNLGTEDSPHIRAFYLSDLQSQLIKKKKFVPGAEFSLVEREEDETLDEDTDIEE